MLGALWSYTELGWGGYWAWDPVENASLMPWLVGTAFIHSIMVQEKRGHAEGLERVADRAPRSRSRSLGTFLVRSGILDSIHAFGASTIGVPVPRLHRRSCWRCRSASSSAGCPTCAARRSSTRCSRASRSSCSTTCVLVGLCLVIFWGTFFPLISEALTGEQGERRAALVRPADHAAGAGAGAAVRNRPGAGLAAGHVDLAAARRWSAPLVVAALAVVAAAHAHHGRPTARRRCRCSTFVAFVLAVSRRSSARRAGARRTMTGESLPRALVRLTGRNRRRYGGYLVHAGIAVLFLGRGRVVGLRPPARRAPAAGDSRPRWTATRSPTSGPPPARRRPRRHRRADLDRRGARACARATSASTLRPSRNFYPHASDPGPIGPISRFFEGEANSEVDVRWGLRTRLLARRSGPT